MYSSPNKTLRLPPWSLAPGLARTIGAAPGIGYTRMTIRHGKEDAMELGGKHVVVMGGSRGIGR